MDDMLHSGADVVVVRSAENLCLVFEPAVRPAVDEPGVVAGEFGAYGVSSVIQGILSFDTLSEFWVGFIYGNAFE
jgi:hypothetical protein